MPEATAHGHVYLHGLQRAQLTLSLLAEAYALDGQAEAGLEVVATALYLVNTRGMHLWEAEVYRLR